VSIYVFYFIMPAQPLALLIECFLKELMPLRVPERYRFAFGCVNTSLAVSCEAWDSSLLMSVKCLCNFLLF